MNRLREYFEQPPDPEGTDDYYEVETNCDLYAVTRDCAIEIERRLDQRPTPRWIVFRDLFGSCHRLLAEGVRRISESTAAQRAAAREFYRARRREAKADRRPWEDDD